MSAPEFEVVRGRMVRIDQRPLPSIEEFARFIYEKGGDTSEVRHSVRRLLQSYAGVWASVEGIPNAKAQAEAEELFELVFLSADERAAEYGR